MLFRSIFTCVEVSYNFLKSMPEFCFVLIRSVFGFSCEWLRCFVAVGARVRGA